MLLQICKQESLWQFKINLVFKPNQTTKSALTMNKEGRKIKAAKRSPRIYKFCKFKNNLSQMIAKIKRNFVTLNNSQWLKKLMQRWKAGQMLKYWT